MREHENVDGSVAEKGGGHDVVLSIIVASYNGRELLKGCLESIQANPPECSFEVIVVDDASTDGTAEAVRDGFANVRLLRNETNVHYGCSNNRAISMSRGRWIYLLNNDTVMLPGALDAMIRFLEEHPEAGAVGSKLLNADGTIQWSVKSLPNPMSALFGARSILTGLAPGNSLSRKHLLHLDRDLSRPFAAGYVSSASMMIPRTVLDRVGYLDERLSYHVDADYCKRIWDSGLQVYYLPSASVIHLDHQGGTMVSRRRRFKSVVEFHRGSYIYFRTHVMTSPWSALHLAAIVGLGARFLISLTLQTYKEVFVEPRRRPWMPTASSRTRGGIKAE